MNGIRALTAIISALRQHHNYFLDVLYTTFWNKFWPGCTAVLSKQTLSSSNKFHLYPDVLPLKRSLTRKTIIRSCYWELEVKEVWLKDGDQPRMIDDSTRCKMGYNRTLKIYNTQIINWTAQNIRWMKRYKLVDGGRRHWVKSGEDMQQHAEASLSVVYIKRSIKSTNFYLTKSVIITSNNYVKV